LGIFIHELAKYLVKLGRQVYIITLGYSEDKKYEVRDGVKIYRIRLNKLLPFRNFLVFLLISKKLITLNKEYDFDIINSHFVGALTGLIGTITKLIRKPFIVTAYGIGLVYDTGLRCILNKIYFSFI
ncbi:MAG: glycosyltransferase, partial [Bacteroidetes bacterium]|nr:glycosyltransferase [Bacteroidota bacterium]